MPPEIRAAGRAKWGLTDATIDRWMIGWAGGDGGPEWEGPQGKLSRDEAKAAGLLGPQRILTPFFRNRILFPISRLGSVTWVKGRAIEGDLEAMVGPGFHTPDVDEKGSPKYKGLPLLDHIERTPLIATLRQHWGARVLRLKLGDALPAPGQVALHQAQDAEDEAQRAAACVLTPFTASAQVGPVTILDPLVEITEDTLLRDVDWLCRLSLS